MSIKEKLHQVIFEADTPAGKNFDIILLVLIVASVLTVLIESVEEIHNNYGMILMPLEWIFTALFTIEYVVRLYSVRKPLKYALSFYGIIDLMAIIPTYLSLLLVGSQSLLVVRGLRLLRVFRILKLKRFQRESQTIIRALRASQTKITIFLFSVVLIILIVGSLMYLIEGHSGNAGFKSIPRSIYWAIVTITTVGFGDITPQTQLGQFFAAILMIIGYAIIAVPTGIVSSEMMHQKQVANNTISCQCCGKEGHDDDAKFCKYCGEELNWHEN